jgi:hypothetical protein
MFHYVFALMMGGFIFLFLPKRMETEAERKIKMLFDEGKNKGMAQVMTVAIEPEVIKSDNGLSESTSRWSLVEKIEVTDGYIFVYTSAINAIIIPNRAFETDRDREEFILLMRQYHQAAMTISA